MWCAIHLQNPASVDKEVLWLDITVHNVVLMTPAIDPSVARGTSNRVEQQMITD